jgi:hypothetical protein
MIEPQIEVVGAPGIGSGFAFELTRVPAFQRIFRSAWYDCCSGQITEKSGDWLVVHVLFSLDNGDPIGAQLSRTDRAVPGERFTLPSIRGKEGV